MINKTWHYEFIVILCKKIYAIQLNVIVSSEETQYDDFLRKVR